MEASTLDWVEKYIGWVYSGEKYRWVQWVGGMKCITMGKSTVSTVGRITGGYSWKSTGGYSGETYSGWVERWVSGGRQPG